MVLEFKVVTTEFVNPTDYPIGIVKDAYITSEHPTRNYGGATSMLLGFITDGAGVPIAIKHCVVEIQIPDKGDRTGLDELVKVSVKLKTLSALSVVTLTTFVVAGIVEISDNFDEGALNNANGWCNWAEKIDSIAWERGSGACLSKVATAAAENLYDVEDGPMFDTIRFVTGTYNDATFEFDITDAVSFGDKKRFAIMMFRKTATAAGHGTTLYFGTKENATANLRPVLEITYRDYQVDAFGDKDSALSIEPNPLNPEQPLLKWGGVKDTDFVNFKLYRETSAIASVTGKTPIATITSPADQEYIDTAATVDGTKYYYLVIAEDGNNTGNDATFSNQIEWTKPKVVTGSITTNSGAQNVGVQSTITVTSGNRIKKLYIDWKDNCTSWYEYEVVGLSKTATHIYSIASGALRPALRVEDELGFWSALTNSSNTITLVDTTPTAKLRVSVKKGLLGDYVTLDASLSQPAGSNISISKYEFQRDAADGWYDNGTNPIYTFKTGTGGGEYPQTIGVKTASVSVSVPVGLSAISSATYELESGTATKLVLTADCKIHQLDHDLSQDKMVEVPIGSAGVAHEFLISRPPERVTLVGTSNYPNVVNDVTVIRNAWLNNTFVSFTVSTEMEGKIVTYTGRIDGDISLGQRYDNKQSFTFPLRVITRTEA